MLQGLATKVSGSVGPFLIQCLLEQGYGGGVEAKLSIESQDKSYGFYRRC